MPMKHTKRFLSMRVVLALVNVCLTFVSATVYFEDRFLDGTIGKWQKSSQEPDKLGVCEFAQPEDVFDKEYDGGIKTKENARFFRYSAPFTTALSNKDKEMCIQFSVKHEQDIDCGGGYVKLMGQSFKSEDFTGDTDYEIMFGPDICGYDTRKVHVIFSHNGKNHLVKKSIHCKTDTKTHLYTLVVRPDNTFEVLIDRESVENGSLVTDFDMVSPKMIDDPEATKPADWVDNSEMPDPKDTKPGDWDQPKTIIDAEAKKPADWDDETDGDWETPMVDNPAYKGEWSPKMIPNPDYKGPWKAPQIENPDFKDEPGLYARAISNIGLDLWQVKAGTIFDDFIVSDDLSECENHAGPWKRRFDAETEAEAQKKKDEEAKKEAEEAAKKNLEDVEKKDDDDVGKGEDKDDDDVEEEKDEEHGPKSETHEEL